MKVVNTDLLMVLGGKGLDVLGAVMMSEPLIGVKRIGEDGPEISLLQSQKGVVLVPQKNQVVHVGAYSFVIPIFPIFSCCLLASVPLPGLLLALSLYEGVADEDTPLLQPNQPSPAVLS